MDQTTKSCQVVVEVQDLSQSEVLTQNWTPVKVSSQNFISCQDINQAPVEVVKLLQKNVQRY